MRGLFLAVVAAVVLSGCRQPEMSMGPPKKPDPAPEMAKLERMIGTWSGTAEMISPSAEEMKKMMPEGGEEMPSTFAGGHKTEWALGGMFLKSEGWHEMGEGERATYVEYVTWDPKAKKFRSWFYSDWGEFGEARWKGDPDGDTFRVTAKGFKADGSRMTGKGELTFVNDDTMEWTWSERGPMGKIELKGTSHRAP